MAEMTADGWIPTGGRRPELPAGTLIRCRNATTGGESGKDYCIEEFINWPNLSHYRLAQPAAQEWRNTAELPDEGVVVGLNRWKGPMIADPFAKAIGGVWHFCNADGGRPEKMGHPQYYEWRYPDGPSDAAEVHCSGSSDAQGNTRSVLGAGNPVSEQERRQGKPGDVGGNVPAHCNEPHPYRSRNGYGLRIREANEREREPLLISYDVFRRMK